MNFLLELAENSWKIKKNMLLLKPQQGIGFSGRQREEADNSCLSFDHSRKNSIISYEYGGVFRGKRNYEEN